MTGWSRRCIVISLSLVDDLYTVFGVKSGVTDAELRTIHAKLVLQHHPDQGGDAATLRAINRAWAVLSDGQRRASYDAWRCAGPADRPEDVVEKLVFQAMDRVGQDSASREAAALDAADIAWSVLADVGRDPAMRAEAAHRRRLVQDRRKRLTCGLGGTNLVPRADSARYTPIDHVAPQPPRATAPCLLVPDLDTLLDTNLLDDFVRHAPEGDWLLVVSGHVFACLDELRTASTPVLAHRVSTVLRLLNRATAAPAQSRRIWTETQNRWGVADTVDNLLSTVPGATALVVAASDADQLRLRVDLQRWGRRVQVGGLEVWRTACRHDVWRQPGAERDVQRAPFRERSQQNLVRGGYAALIVVAGGLPAWLWAFSPLHLPVAAYVLLWAIIACCLIALLRGLGRLLSASPLARPLSRMDGGLRPEQRGAYWLGLLACVTATAGLALVVLAVGLCVSAQDSTRV